MKLGRRHTNTLAQIFEIPTRANIKFAEIEKLVVALGGEIIEGRGSRVAFKIKGRKIFLHRPHPGKEAMKYQVEEIRRFIDETGVKDEE